MLDLKLGILLVVCVVFMVWLGVEGFELFVRSNQQLLSMKYGLGKVDAKNDFSKIGKTASDFPSASAYKSASNWQGTNQGDNANIYKDYKLASLVDADADIRRLDRDPSSRPSGGPARWLTYFDDTDYSASDIVRRTGSRWNDTAYVDSDYYKEDATGGRHLIQCKSDDFDCIRNLSYSDPDYQPMDRQGNWQQQFGGTGTAGGNPDTATFDQQLQRALQVLQQAQIRNQQTQGNAAPAPAGGSGSTPTADAAAATSASADLPACLAECLADNKIVSPTAAELNACYVLCTKKIQAGA